MFTNITPIEELKQLFVEFLLNNTTEVSKVSDNSTLSGIGYGVSKVGQKAMNEVAIVEAHLFPQEAHGDHLDVIAQTRGIAQRFGASSSSTYLRVVGDNGTVYLAGTHTFSGNAGITFELDADVTIGVHGYAYAKVHSTETGEKANVPSISINKINTEPVGHQYVINEYEAIGGRDIESDNLFRKRILRGANIAARGTLEYITQAFMKVNSDVLRVYHYGYNLSGQVVLGVATQNGIDLTATQLTALLSESEQFFNLTELNAYGTQIFQVEIKNVDYYPLDVSFRVELFPSADPDVVRDSIQMRMSKYLDLRVWDYSQKIEWDDLLEIVKSTTGVKYVPDQYFTPNVDKIVPTSQLPRLRGFLMLDTSGNIIRDASGVLSPSFYPSAPDFSFHQTVLATL